MDSQPGKYSLDWLGTSGGLLATNHVWPLHAGLRGVFGKYSLDWLGTPGGLLATNHVWPLLSNFRWS